MTTPDASVPNAAPPVLALVRDLMFSGRITAEARAAGVGVKVVRDPSKLPDAPADARLLIADLQLDGSLDAAAAWRTAGTDRQVVGFASHVDVDTIGRARAAGLDHVVSRGQFVQILPTLLRGEDAGPA